jgi:hypothetical protein
MKRLLISSLALFTAVALTACEGNDDVQVGPGGEAGQQNLGNSAALCYFGSGQGQPEVRKFEWNGNREDSFDVLSNRGGPSRTSASWNLKPESRGQGQTRRAEGQLVLQQGGSQVTVRSALGGFVNLNVSNGNPQSAVDLHCVSNAAFRREAGGDLNRVVCRYRLDQGDRDRDRARSRDEVINWNGRPQERELIRGRDGESVVLRIKNGGRLEIEARNLENRKSVKAEGLINEGLEIRYRGRSSSSDLMVSCGAASK